MPSDQSSVVVASRADGSCELKLAGDISVLHAADLHLAALQFVEHRSRVVVECSRLQSLDLAAVQVLLAFQRAQAAQGREFCMEGMSWKLAESLSLAGLGRDFAVPRPVAGHDDASGSAETTVRHSHA